MPISGNITFSNGGTLIIPDYYGVSRRSGTNTIRLEGSLTSGTLAFRAGEAIDDGAMSYAAISDISGVAMNWTTVPQEKVFRVRAAQFILNLGAGGVCNVNWIIF